MSQILNAARKRKLKVRGEFTVELRHRCRFCRSKLPVPVENARRAFCTPGCHSSFFRKRCLVCEEPIVRRTENQKVCGRRKCRLALKTLSPFPSKRTEVAWSVILTPETPVKSALKHASAADRPWRIVAGPELSAGAFHCATIGAAETVEANRRGNARHWREAGAGALISRIDPPINLLGGYKFPNAPDVDLTSPAAPAAAATVSSHTFSDDLSIPNFLKVTP